MVIHIPCHIHPFQLKLYERVSKRCNSEMKRTERKKKCFCNLGHGIGRILLRKHTLSEHAIGFFFRVSVIYSCSVQEGMAIKSHFDFNSKIFVLGGRQIPFYIKTSQTNISFFWGSVQQLLLKNTVFWWKTIKNQSFFVFYISVKISQLFKLTYFLIYLFCFVENTPMVNRVYRDCFVMA